MLDGAINHDKVTRFLSEREYTSKVTGTNKAGWMTAIGQKRPIELTLQSRHTYYGI
jgi:hypothetical protein